MKIASKTMCVTQEQAIAWLKDAQFPNQRPIKKPEVAKYIAIMRAGDWVAGSTISFGLVPELSLRYLLNGQHRLTAQAQVGAPIEYDVKEYTWKAAEPYMEQMKAIYAVEDTGAKRTVRNMIAAYDLEGEIGTSTAFLARMLAALRIIASGMSVTDACNMVMPQQEQVALLLEWRDTITQAWGILPKSGAESVGPGRYLYAAPALAVMLYTMRYAPDTAPEFWTSVIENDGLRKGTPAHTLRTFVTENTVMKVDRNVYLRKVVHAWNAYYEGRGISMLTVRDPHCQIVINGTPFK